MQIECGCQLYSEIGEMRLVIRFSSCTMPSFPFQSLHVFLQRAFFRSAFPPMALVTSIVVPAFVPHSFLRIALARIYSILKSSRSLQRCTHYQHVAPSIYHHVYVGIHHGTLHRTAARCNQKQKFIDMRACTRDEQAILRWIPFPHAQVRLCCNIVSRFPIRCNVFLILTLDNLVYVCLNIFYECLLYICLPHVSRYADISRDVSSISHSSIVYFCGICYFANLEWPRSIRIS